MTAPVPSAIAPTSTQGDQTPSAVPPHLNAAQGQRFSDLLARRIQNQKDTTQADATADVPALPCPNAHDAAQNAAAHATQDAAGLNAHIAMQVTLLTQGSAQTDASHDPHAETAQTQTISQLDTGRSPRFAPRATHAVVVGDVHAAGVDAQVDINGFDPATSLRGNTAGPLTRSGKKQATATSMTAHAASDAAHAVRTKPVTATSAAEALSANAQANPSHAVGPLSLTTGASMDMSANAAAGHDGNVLGAPLHLTQPAAGFTANPGNMSPTTGTGIAMPLSHPQWPQALGQHVLHLSQTGVQGPQTAELRLDPPELGPLRISIELHQSVAHATFVSAHAPVRHAVEHALPQLQEQLAQAGISLGQTSVSDQGGAQQDSAQDAAPRAPFTLASASTPAPAERQTTAPARAPNALIDTFV